MLVKRLFYLFSFITALMYFGCSKDFKDTLNSPGGITNPGASDIAGSDLEKRTSDVSAVYTQSNSSSGNAVLMYLRSGDGTLNFGGSFPTGGTGTGSGLGSQGSVVLYRNFVFTVNAGSNEISAFRVSQSGLTLLDKVSSQGQMPISLTVHRNLLYVLNAGGTGNIAGFRLSVSGGISFIKGSVRPLSSSAAQPAQIEFTPSGEQIIVTEKATNLILSYNVENNGTTAGPVTHPSSGMTPFGFEFDNRGYLIVSEAFGGAAGQGAMSSYNVYSGLSLISGSVADHQTAPCWVVVTNNGRYAYTTNAGSSNISGYFISNNGSLSLFNDGGNTASTGAGSHPIDMALSNNSKYLYNLNSGTNTITSFKVNSGGSLAPVQTITGLPSGSTGLAAN